MKEILFRGKRDDNGEWVVGDLLQNIDCIQIREQNTWSRATRAKTFVVNLVTVGQYTGLKDKNGTKIFEGDIVEFLGMRGDVCFECGSFGIEFYTKPDWELIEKQIESITGCKNSLRACINDNFISLWEIYWNFNCVDKIIETIVIFTPSQN